MSTLTKPRLFILSSFGALTFIIIIYIFYQISLSFFNFFYYEATLYVATPIIIISFIVLYLDYKLKTQLKRYCILAFVIFLVSLLFFPVLKNFIIKDTEFKAQKLAEAVQKYKIKYGFWPKSLDDPYFANYSKNAIVQRPFHYKLEKLNNEDTSAVIRFPSFDGQQGILMFNTTEVITNTMNFIYTD
jgi:hypothetical protein